MCQGSNWTVEKILETIRQPRETKKNIKAPSQKKIKVNKSRNNRVRPVLGNNGLKNSPRGKASKFPSSKKIEKATAAVTSTPCRWGEPKLA